MKQILFTISFCVIHILCQAQDAYKVTGNTTFPVANGTYINTGLQSDGVNYYKHVSESVYMFRAVFGVDKYWLLACDPSPTANLIYDLVQSASNTPPTSGWGAGFVALPVELADFSVQLENKQPILRWITLSEKNNKGFEVERSLNGVDFEKIAFIEGYGTTQEKHEYSFLDDFNFSNILYYRLKQIDFNGDFKYSEIISINSKQLSTTISIFPNPMTGFITLDLQNEENTRLQIYNLNGQLLQEINSLQSNSPIDLTHLSNGTYLFLLIGETSKQQFIIIKN